MKKLFFLSLFVTLAFTVHAKVWRINNTPGVAADFSTCALALASTSVVNDDTLHIEGSATAYAAFTLP